MYDISIALTQKRNKCLKLINTVKHIENEQIKSKKYNMTVKKNHVRFKNVSQKECLHNIT